ncbi:substrate-binding domain-containing protein [Streptomyces decoyicus]|uniref:substrate-binding domain-containing protein n=1 Tax=Streptomyces decoyicus TaxID=249567 RepID=UPI00362B2865
MRPHGLDDHIRILRGDHTEEAGERAARHLLDSGDLPTAVVAFNDRCAIGVLAALRRSGVFVPGEVSVAGYDDTFSRLSCFSLSTASQRPEEQARHAVTAAVERLGERRIEPPRSRAHSAPRGGRDHHRSHLTALRRAPSSIRVLVSWVTACAAHSPAAVSWRARWPSSSAGASSGYRSISGPTTGAPGDLRSALPCLPPASRRDHGALHRRLSQPATPTTAYQRGPSPPQRPRESKHIGGNGR